MKITKEDFNKLKQLDRIEYRQKFTVIEDYFGDCFETIYGLTCKCMIGLLFFLGYMGIMIGIDTESSLIIAKALSSIVHSLITFIIVILALVLIMEVINCFRKWKTLKELDKKYFEISQKK